MHCSPTGERGRINSVNLHLIYSAESPTKNRSKHVNMKRSDPACALSPTSKKVMMFRFSMLTLCAVSVVALGLTCAAPAAKAGLIITYPTATAASSSADVLSVSGNYNTPLAGGGLPRSPLRRSG
jgi:hypothetical protein